MQSYTKKCSSSKIYQGIKKPVFLVFTILYLHSKLGIELGKADIYIQDNKGKKLSSKPCGIVMNCLSSKIIFKPRFLYCNVIDVQHIS